jgi:hypothetical protein
VNFALIVKKGCWRVLLHQTVSSLDVLVEDFFFHPPRGMARRLAADRVRVTDDAYHSSQLGTSPGYWLRFAGKGTLYRSVWDALEDG